jgi:hypothetical protein
LGAKKAVQDIGVHREREKVVATSVVMRHFCILRGACPRLAIVTRECWFAEKGSGFATPHHLPALFHLAIQAFRVYGY